MTPIRLNYEATLEECITELESSALSLSGAILYHTQESNDGIILWFCTPDEQGDQDEDDPLFDCDG